MLSRSAAAISLRPPHRQPDRPGRQGSRAHPLAAGVPSPGPHVSLPLHACPRRVRQAVRQQPAQRLSPLLRDRQAGDHHLRRHARLLAADERQLATPSRRRSRSAAGSSSGTSADGRRASGCRSAATSPGVDELLRDCGIRYFFTDTHGVLFAEPRPRYGVYAPIICPKSGVACLARDTESSKQVWSAVEGYPGDYIYREFYRDVGFDLDYEYLKPHLHQIGIRSHLGIKYYKITGRDRSQAALRSAGRPGQGGRACRQLHVQPRETGRMACAARWTAGRR